MSGIQFGWLRPVLGELSIFRTCLDAGMAPDACRPHFVLPADRSDEVQAVRAAIAPLEQVTAPGVVVDIAQAREALGLSIVQLRPLVEIIDPSALLFLNQLDRPISSLHNSLQSIIATLNEPIGVFEVRPDRDIRLIMLNEAVARDTGYTEAELRSIDFMEKIHDEDKPSFKQFLADISRNLTGTVERVRINVRDGSYRYFNISAGLIVNDNSRADNALGCFFLDRLPTEEELLAEHRKTVFQDIVGGIAHDINNLLAMLKGAQELVIRFRKNGEHERANEWMAEAMDVVGLITGHIRELRGLGADDGPTDIRTLLTKRKLLLNLGSDCMIEIDIDDKPWCVRGSHSQLSQVLYNLLKNAKNAMQGMQEKQFSVATERLDLSDDDIASLVDHTLFPNVQAGRFIKITMRDTGPGIPEHIRRRIYETGFTTRGRKKSEPPVTKRAHSGFGLSNVREIVAALGGFVSLETELDAWAEFSVYLPEDV